MAIEIGTAFVSIIPSARGLQANLTRELAPVSGIAAAEGAKAGKTLGGGVTKGLQNSLRNAARAAESFGVPFAAQLAVVDSKLDLSNVKTGNLVKTLSKLGGTTLLAAGAGLVIAGTQAVHAADQFEISHARLETVVANTGQNFSAAAPGVRDLDNAFVKLGFNTSDTENSLSRLTAATGNVAKATRLMGLAADIARARNIPLQQSTDLLSKASLGNYIGLRRLGIVSKEDIASFKNLGDVTTFLTAKFGGQGAAFADTFAGKMAALKAQANQLEVTLGTALVPKIQAFASGTVGAVQGLENANRATDGFLGKIALAGVALPVAVFATEKLGLAGAAVGGGLSKAGAAALNLLVPSEALAIANESVAVSAAHAAVEEVTLAGAFGAASTAIIPVGLAYLGLKAANTALTPSLQSSSAAVDKLTKGFAVLGTTGSSRFLIQQYGASFSDLAKNIETASHADSGFLANKGAIGGFIVHVVQSITGARDGFQIATQAINDTSKSLSNLYKTDPQAAITAFTDLKANAIANGVSAKTVDQVYKDLETTLHLLPGPVNAATQAQTNLTAAQQKFATDIIAKAPGSVLAKDFLRVKDASSIVANAQAQVEAATNAGATALHRAAAAADKGAFAYLGLASSVKTAGDALSAITAKDFGPTRAVIAADTSRTNVQSALDALNNPDTGSSGGGSGQTATAAALEQAQKVLTLRDAKRGETQATQAVKDAEQALTQSRKDATTAAKAVTVAQENLRTTLKGVSRDSQTARDAINALTAAQNAAEGSKLSVNDARRAVSQARLDAQSKRLAVTDAQTTLQNSIADQADPEQIAKDTIALKAARLAAAGSADAVKQAELNLSNAQLDAKQKTKDLTEAQRVENGTLHGYKPASDEAKVARQQLTDAQTQARTATDAVRQAQEQLTTATNSTADAALSLVRAQADLDGKLTASKGAASAGKKLDSLQTRINNVRTAVLQLADDAGKADLATGHSFGHSILTMIQVLEQEAAASPLLAHAFDQALKDLESQFAAQVIKSQQPAGLGGGVKIKGTGIVRRASGGPLSADQPAFVGESGIELFVPKVDGTIVPNNSLKNSRPAAGAFGGGDTYNIYASTLEAHRIGGIVTKALEEHNGGFLSSKIKTTS